MRTVTADQISAEFLELDKNAQALESVWDETLPDLPRPDRAQSKRWLRLSNGDITRYAYAFERAAIKQRTAGSEFKDKQDHPIRWISSVANSYRREHAA